MFLCNKQYCDQEESNCSLLILFKLNRKFNIDEALPGVLGTGKMAFISRETGKVRPTFDGNRRTREHKITNFRWGEGGAGEHAPLFRGTWGHLPPPLWDGLANVSSAKHIKA